MLLGSVSRKSVFFYELFIIAVPIKLLLQIIGLPYDLIERDGLSSYLLINKAIL